MIVLRKMKNGPATIRDKNKHFLIIGFDLSYIQRTMLASFFHQINSKCHRHCIQKEWGRGKGGTNPCVSTVALLKIVGQMLQVEQKCWSSLEQHFFKPSLSSVPFSFSLSLSLASVHVRFEINSSLIGMAVITLSYGTPVL